MESIVLVKCGSYNDGTFWGVIENIGENELENLKKLGKAIKERSDRWNWTNDTKLVNYNGEWVPERKVYGFYPEINRDIIDWFSLHIPWRTECIEEIRILKVGDEDKIV